MRNIFDVTSRRPGGAVLAVTFLGCVCILPAAAQVKSANGLTALTVQNPNADKVDFVNAKALSLPVNASRMDPIGALISALTSQKFAPALAGHTAGSEGSGALSPAFVGVPAASGSGFSPNEYGTSNHPFTTARADLNSGGSDATNLDYPYRAAGKLFFKIGTSTYICSASLIKRGVVVTAAHCVANYGKSQFYSGWQFVPGYRNGAAPYGTFTVAQAWVKSAYYNGTDGCAQYGVVCPDDVALLVLNTDKAVYPGTATGWFGYGYNGYGFTNSNQTQITQLGYPAGLDNAAYMERNDSYGYVNSSSSNNTIIGSNMDGGSSGGPWLANFGIPSTLTGETQGSEADANVVVGVTSWGSTSTAPKEQGAAPFTSNNIVSLLNSACSAIAAACN